MKHDHPKGSAHFSPQEVQVIVTCLKQIMLNEGYSNLVVNDQIRGAKLEGATANRVRKVVYGTIEHWLYLEAWLSNLTHKGMKPDVKMLLMAGLYELNYLSGTHDHVIVNRYVNAVLKIAPHAKDYVHAILRRAQREPLDLSGLDLKNRLSLTYSHPIWLVGKWLKRLGEVETEALLQANLAQRPLALRVNTLRATQGQVLDSLLEAGAKAELDPYLDNAILVHNLGGNNLETLSCFSGGWVTVQDVSSMLVGHIAAPRTGESWLDMCAAPGGKATDLAVRTGPGGRVIACDLHEHKLPLIQENADRMGLGQLEVRKQDARIRVEAFEGAFDGVVLDAPCSGFGIIGRKPEIKYRKRPEDIGALSLVQKGLLELAGDYVKPGGYLIYSTCTIFKEENEDQILDFLDKRADYVCESIEGLVPVGVPLASKDVGMMLLRQSNGWSDGFFIAKLRRLPK